MPDFGEVFPVAEGPNGNAERHEKAVHGELVFIWSKVPVYANPLCVAQRANPPTNSLLRIGAGSHGEQAADGDTGERLPVVDLFAGKHGGFMGCCWVHGNFWLLGCG